MRKRSPLLEPRSPALRIASTERRGLGLWRRDAIVNGALWVAAAVPATAFAADIARSIAAQDLDSLFYDPALHWRAAGFLLGSALLLWILHQVAAALALRRLGVTSGGAASSVSAALGRLPKALLVLFRTSSFAWLTLIFLTAVGTGRRGYVDLSFPLWWLMMPLPAAIGPCVVLAENLGIGGARRQARALSATQASGGWLMRLPFALFTLLWFFPALFFPTYGRLALEWIPVALPGLLLWASLWGAVNASDYAALREALDGRAVAAVFE